MKQIICNQPGQLELRNVEKPLLKPGEAIIKLKRIGICGTDLHAYEGTQPYFDYPRVLGHELSGVIDEVDESSDLKVGDKVAVIPYLNCGTCYTCKKGKTNCCQNLKVMGVHQDGGMQEYMSVPVSHLMKVNDLSFDEAALMEPLAIGAHAVRRVGMEKNDTVVVSGAGPIGIGIMLFAKAMGTTVIAVDLNVKRLEFCKEWADIDHIVDANQDVLAQIKEITDGNMADIVLDATGNKQSMEQSLDYITFGGKVIYVGLIKGKIEFNDPDFHKRETTLMGSRNATIEDFLNVYELLQKRQFDLQQYITHRSTFDQVSKDLPNWLNPESNVIKGVIEV